MSWNIIDTLLLWPYLGLALFRCQWPRSHTIQVLFLKKIHLQSVISATQWSAQPVNGDYCDNTRLSCTDTNYFVYSRSWSTNFSEEGVNYRFCGSNQIMTGISCAGGYCDNNSIECSTIPRTRYNCQWVGPYSEEQGFRYFSGKYANGMYCSGSNCDNHWYYVCNY